MATLTVKPKPSPNSEYYTRYPQALLAVEYVLRHKEKLPKNTVILFPCDSHESNIFKACNDRGLNKFFYVDNYSTLDVTSDEFVEQCNSYEAPVFIFTNPPFNVFAKMWHKMNKLANLAGYYLWVDHKSTPLCHQGVGEVLRPFNCGADRFFITPDNEVVEAHAIKISNLVNEFVVDLKRAKRLADNHHVELTPGCKSLVFVPQAELLSIKKDTELPLNMFYNGSINFLTTACAFNTGSIQHLYDTFGMSSVLIKKHYSCHNMITKKRTFTRFEITIKGDKQND